MALRTGAPHVSHVGTNDSWGATSNVDFTSGKNRGVADQWEEFFDIKADPTPRDPYDNYNRSQRSVEDAFVGTSKRMEELIITFYAWAKQFPIRRMLPWTEVSNALKFSWDTWHFGDHLLTDEPAFAVPRLVTSRVSKNSATIGRLGIGATLEYEFAQTQRGRIAFKMHCLQIINAVLFTMCMNVYYACLNPAIENLPDMFREKSFADLPTLRRFVMKHTDNFAGVHKSADWLSNRLAALAEEMYERCRRAGNVLTVPSRTIAFAQKDPALKTKIYVPPKLDPGDMSGGKTNTMHSEDGTLTIFESSPIPQGMGLPANDPLYAPTTIAHHWIHEAQHVAGVDPDEYRSSFMDVDAFSELKNDWHTFTYEKSLENTGLFHTAATAAAYALQSDVKAEAGDLSHIGLQVLEGFGGNWGAWMRDTKTLKPWVDRLMMAGNKTNNTRRAKFLELFQDGKKASKKRLYPVPAQYAEGLYLPAVPGALAPLVIPAAVPPPGTYTSRQVLELAQRPGVVLPLWRNYMNVLTIAGLRGSANGHDWKMDESTAVYNALTASIRAIDVDFKAHPAWVPGTVPLNTLLHALFPPSVMHEHDAKRAGGAGDPYIRAQYDGKTWRRYPTSRDADRQHPLSRMSFSVGMIIFPRAPGGTSDTDRLGTILAGILPSASGAHEVKAALNDDDKKFVETQLNLLTMAMDAPTIYNVQTIQLVHDALRYKLESGNNLHRDAVLDKLEYGVLEPRISKLVVQTETYDSPNEVSEAQIGGAAKVRADMRGVRPDYREIRGPGFVEMKRLGYGPDIAAVVGAHPGLSDADFDLVFQSLLTARDYCKSMKIGAQMMSSAIATAMELMVSSDRLIAVFKHIHTAAVPEAKRPLVLAHTVLEAFALTGMANDAALDVVPGTEAQWGALFDRLPINQALVNFGLQWHMPPLFNVLCVRQPTYITGTGIYMCGDGVAGQTLHARHNWFISLNTEQETIHCHYSLWGRAVIFNALAILHLPNMVVRDYIAGNHVSYWNPLDETHRAEYAAGEYNSHDVFAIALRPDENMSDNPFISLTGHLHKQLVGLMPGFEDDGQAHFSTAKVYAPTWGWEHDEIHPLDSVQYQDAGRNNLVTMSWRCTHWVYGSAKFDSGRGVRCRPIRHTGHMDDYPGVADVRRMNSMFFREQDYNRMLMYTRATA